MYINYNKIQNRFCQKLVSISINISFFFFFIIIRNNGELFIVEPQSI